MSHELIPHSLYQMLLKNEKELADKVYLRQPREGVWHEFTWSEVVLAARKVAGFLQSLGLKRGSHIGIISKNCAEWFISDFGITLAGMVSIPLYANQHVESIHYVLEHAEVQLVFIGKLDDHKRVRDYIPEHYKTVGFEYHKDLKVDHKWKEVMKSEPLSDLVEPKPEDLYTIIYSSGTSGNPKGAMYTHQTIANYLGLISKDILRINDLPNYKLVSYLPLAHVYERSAIQLSSVILPSDVSFVESLDKFVKNLVDIKPTFFTAVPRIWGVFQHKIVQKMSFEQLKFMLKIPFVGTQIKKKVLHELGFSLCTNYFSGASFLPVSILEFFDVLGIPIQEGYGQTEDLAYVTVSLLKDRKIGSVGTARLGVELKIGEESELLVKSPCLMSGYYKDEKTTKSALTSDGWLHTGDICELDSMGRLKILGRISEIFKNQTGEFVAPSPIEQQFVSNGLIEQLCLVGRGLPTNILLVSLNEDASTVNKKEAITEILQHQLHEVNSKLIKFEKISHIIVTKSAWNSENGLLTPTLKVKRRQLEEHYQSLIQQALTEKDRVIWE